MKLTKVKLRFTEEKLERAFTELLGHEGFSHHLGITIARKPDEVLIEEDLQHFLMVQYAREGITVNEVKSVILQLKSLPSSDLYESNKTFMRMLSDGFILKREDRNQKDIYIQLINYAGLTKNRQPNEEQLLTIAAEPEAEYSPDTNIYKFVNQLEVLGTEKRIPDGVVYTNGLPLVVLEFKSAIREEATIYDILKVLCMKYDLTYPEDKLIALVKAVKDLADGQANYPDWNKRDDIKSDLKVGLILLLDEYGYPPVERDEVYVEIFEQAENFKKNSMT